MKFSFEVPIKYLEELDNEQDYLFILGHHLLKNKKYFNYCKNSKKFKILDNSAYELGKSIKPRILKKLAKDINANIIIIPDVLFNKKESERLENRFLRLFTSKERKKFKFMKVVCGNNIKEYIESLKEVNEDNNVDMIGISRSRTMIMPNLSFIMNLIDFKKPIHLLGLSHPYEILEAKKYSQIKTIDTGLPINFAFQNKIFPIIKKAENFKRISGEDIDTEKELDLNLSINNIKILKEYYNGTNN